MDNFFKLILLLSLIGDAYAIPNIPKYSVSKAGTTSSFKFDPNGSFTPSSIAPVGSAIKPLSPNLSVFGTNYIADSRIPIGQSLAIVRQTSAISPLNLAVGAISLLGKFNQIGLLIAAGSALHDYLSGSDLILNSDGSITELVNSGTYCTAQNTFCMSTAELSCRARNPYYVPQSAITAEPLANACFGSPGAYCLLNGSQQSLYCSWDQNSSNQPFTYDQAKTKLTLNPPGDFAPLVDQIHKIDPFSDPLSGPFDLSLPSSSLVSSPTQTVTPTGSIQTATDTISLTKIASDQFEATSSTITTTTNIDNTTSTVTTNNAPASTSELYQTDCEKFPDNIACSKYGDIPPPDVIPINPVSVPFSPTSWGSGSCPAPLVLSLLSTSSKQFSFSPLCNFMIAMNPVVIAVAFLVSGFIVLGGVRD